MKYLVNKFDTPVITLLNNLKKYDIVRFEYGDEDNWVNAIVLDAEITEENNLFSTVRLTVVSVDSPQCIFNVYNHNYNDSTYQIVGSATPIPDSRNSYLRKEQPVYKRAENLEETDIVELFINRAHVYAVVKDTSLAPHPTKVGFQVLHIMYTDINDKQDHYTEITIPNNRIPDLYVVGKLIENEDKIYYAGFDEIDYQA